MNFKVFNLENKCINKYFISSIILIKILNQKSKFKLLYNSNKIKFLININQIIRLMNYKFKNLKYLILIMIFLILNQ